MLPWLLAPALLLAAGGCQVVRPAAGSADNTDYYCAAPHQLFAHDTLAAAQARRDTATLPGLSARSRQLARAYGLGPGLRRLGQLRAAASGPTSPAYPAFVRQRQALVLQLEQASADVLRVAEELDCEKQRTDLSAVALQSVKDKQTNRLTVGSLLAGAASGVVSATVRAPSAANLNLVLTVSTAALSAALGVAVLRVNPRLAYPLPQNLLADIWYQRPHPALYPAGLWAALGEVRAGPLSAGLPAPLQTIRQRWARYDQLAGGKPKAQAQQQALFFGAGGNYQIADLHTRTSMLTQVAVYVREVNQDLQKLRVEVSSIEPR